MSTTTVTAKKYPCEVTQSAATPGACACRTCQWYEKMMKLCVCGHSNGAHADHVLDMCFAPDCQCRKFAEATR